MKKSIKKLISDINCKNYYGFALDDEVKNCKKYQKRMRKERDKYGFDRGELLNLDITIAKFLYSRLKRFKEVNMGYPANMTEKEWNRKIDKMMYGLKKYIDDKSIDKEESLKDLKKSMKLITKYYEHLWY